MEDKKLSIAILAGGCFWCTEAIFNRVEGVEEVVSGYTGGTIKEPTYKEICTGKTGHAEAVKIIYNEDKISFAGLLEIFFATHDPTTLNKQGNDIGTQYRSAIFCCNDFQKAQANSFIEMLEEENVFVDKIVTEVTDAKPFYMAEGHHQNYYEYNHNQPYCRVVVEPKINKIEKYYRNKLKKVNAV